MESVDGCSCFHLLKIFVCQSCEVLPPLSKINWDVNTLVPPVESQ